MMDKYLFILTDYISKSPILKKLKGCNVTLTTANANSRVQGTSDPLTTNTVRGAVAGWSKALNVRGTKRKPKKIPGWPPGLGIF